MIDKETLKTIINQKGDCMGELYVPCLNCGLFEDCGGRWKSDDKKLERAKEMVK